MLIETLTRLGDEGSPEVQTYVREMMDKAVKISAELVYMGLLQVSVSPSNFCFELRLMRGKETLEPNPTRVLV